uniref:Uncharacterized protein n=1 Tax=Eutreptiella gymnastica TaxID=73025 RepID=A0A7S1J0W5_9EUGL
MAKKTLAKQVPVPAAAEPLPVVEDSPATDLVSSEQPKNVDEYLAQQGGPEDGAEPEDAPPCSAPLDDENPAMSVAQVGGDAPESKKKKKKKKSKLKEEPAEEEGEEHDQGVHHQQDSEMVDVGAQDEAVIDQPEAEEGEAKEEGAEEAEKADEPEESAEGVEGNEGLQEDQGVEEDGEVEEDEAEGDEGMDEVGDVEEDAAEEEVVDAEEETLAAAVEEEADGEVEAEATEPPASEPEQDGEPEEATGKKKKKRNKKKKGQQPDESAPVAAAPESAAAGDAAEESIPEVGPGAEAGEDQEAQPEEPTEQGSEGRKKRRKRRKAAPVVEESADTAEPEAATQGDEGLLMRTSSSFAKIATSAVGWASSWIWGAPTIPEPVVEPSSDEDFKPVARLSKPHGTSKKGGKKKGRR